MILVIWYICIPGVVSVIVVGLVIIERALALVLPSILRAVVILITITITTNVCIIVTFAIEVFLRAVFSVHLIITDFFRHNASSFLFAAFLPLMLLSESSLIIIIPL